MFIEVEENQNSKGISLMVFRELDSPRAVRSIRVEKGGQTVMADVSGVDDGGEFVQAFAQKVADSGAGFGYLVYGGAWGIRFRRQDQSKESWDLSNQDQWGEPYMVCAEEADLGYQ